jgi:signal transduction histidine kinase/DNA-binding NarL/FixJ family response regulator
MRDKGMDREGLSALLTGAEGAAASTGHDFLEAVAFALGRPGEYQIGVESLEAGDLLFKEGDAGDEMFVLRTGRIAIFKGEPSAPAFIGLRGPGEAIGEMVLIEDRPRSASGVAAERCELYRIGRDSFRRLVEGYPGLNAAFMSLLSGRLRAADEDRSAAKRQAWESTREAEDLRRIDRERSESFADLSHELLSPIAIVDALLDGLAKGEHGQAVPASSPVFGVMRQNIDRLTRLVERVLAAARQESGIALDPVPTDLRFALASYASEFEYLARSRGISFSRELGEGPGEGAFIAAVDRRGMETILFNLVSNAVKYSNPGGSVSLRLRREGGSPGHALIEVTDEGIGIAEPDQALLFERFRRLKAVDGDRGGHGIGLYLAREIARLHGGDITLSSAPGRGSAFTVSLPLLPEAPEPPCGIGGRAPASMPERRQDDGGAPRRRILFVEDDEDLRAFLKWAFADEYEVVTAVDGADALEALAKPPFPSIIVSDISMPRMDGIALLDAVKSRPETEATPFLFLTGRAAEGDKIRRLDEGAIDYVYKPFSLDELRAKVHAVLRARDAERRAMERRMRAALCSDGAEPAGPEGAADQPLELGAWNFSKRELGVFRLVLEGKGDKAIASELGLSTRTVSSAVSRILAKTRTSSRLEACSVARRGRR